jgi:hypothetical protein
VLCGILWRRDGRGGVLNPFSVLCPSPLLPRQSPRKRVLRAPPFLWNVVSTYHVESFFQGKGNCSPVSIAFLLPTKCPPHGEGTVDGSGRNVSIARFGIALCCPVSSFLSPLRIRSTQSGSLIGIFGTPWWQWVVYYVQTRTCTGYAGVYVTKVNGPWQLLRRCRMVIT